MVQKSCDWAIWVSWLMVSGLGVEYISNHQLDTVYVYVMVKQTPFRPILGTAGLSQLQGITIGASNSAISLIIWLFEQ